MRKIIIGLLMALLLSVPVACTRETAAPVSPTQAPAPLATPGAFTDVLELYVQKTTLKDAARVIGITVPVPVHLPTRFEIQEVYVQDKSVMLLISDGPVEKKIVTHTDAAGTRQRYEIQAKIEMSIGWSPESMIPIRLPVEQVEINGKTGYLSETETGFRLLWNWFPGQKNLGEFQLGLEAGKGISKEDLEKIAESVEFNGTPQLYTLQSDQVIADRLYDIKKGEFTYLAIYEDGSLWAIQMKGLNGPVSQHLRIEKTGKLDKGESDSLLEFFETSGFDKLNKNNQPAISPIGGNTTLSDVHYSVSVRLGSSYRYVMANNYVSPDGGKTYPDMPYPLNEIYVRLKAIANSKTK